MKLLQASAYAAISGGAIYVDTIYTITGNSVTEEEYGDDRLFTLSRDSFLLDGISEPGVFMGTGIQLSPIETICGVRNNDSTVYTLRTTFQA